MRVFRHHRRFDYLPDEENRRFWPFRSGVINLEALERDCDQLHAEAVVAVVRDGEDCILPPELWTEAAKAQKKRRTTDAWEDIISKAIHRSIAGEKSKMLDYVPEVKKINFKGERVWFVASDDLLSDLLSIPKVQQHGAASKRLQNVTKRLGWTYERVWLNAKDKTKPTDPDNPRGFIRKVAEGEFDPGWMEADDKDSGSTCDSSP
jgi:predicted P-loop ATPase